MPLVHTLNRQPHITLRFRVDVPQSRRHLVDRGLTVRRTHRQHLPVVVGSRVYIVLQQPHMARLRELKEQYVADTRLGRVTLEEA